MLCILNSNYCMHILHDSRPTTYKLQEIYTRSHLVHVSTIYTIWHLPIFIQWVMNMNIHEEQSAEWKDWLIGLKSIFCIHWFFNCSSVRHDTRTKTLKKTIMMTIWHNQHSILIFNSIWYLVWILSKLSASVVYTKFKLLHAHSTWF